MTPWKSIVVLAVSVAGCGGMHWQRDPVAGDWRGMADDDQIRRPVALDVRGEPGGYVGHWRSNGDPVKSVDSVEVRGNEIRFETADRGFVGRVAGDTVTGVVLAKPTGAPVGAFTLKREEPVHYSPSSEWSPRIVER